MKARILLLLAAGTFALGGSGSAAQTVPAEVTPAPVSEPLTPGVEASLLARELKSLFDSQASPVETRTRLDRISTRSPQISTVLHQISEDLNSLGVKYPTNVPLDLIFQKQTSLAYEFRDIFSYWKAEQDAQGNRDRNTRIFRDDIYVDVKNAEGPLREEGFGYSAFDSVGAAMLAEMWISRRIGEGPDVRKRRANEFLAYFDRALDRTREGTPAWQLADATAQRDRMKAILDAADARIGANGWTARVTTWVKTVEENCRGTTYAEMARDETATGNQQTGYRWDYRELELRRWRERTGSCDKRRRRIAPSLATDPPAPSVDDPSVKVPYWNAVLRTYKEAAANAEALTKINATLQLYRDEAYARSKTG